MSGHTDRQSRNPTDDEQREPTGDPDSVIEELRSDLIPGMALSLEETVLAHTNDIVIITDAQLDEPGPRILYANKAFEIVTGWRVDEAIGRSPRLLQGDDTDRAELDRMRRAMARGESVRSEILNYTKNGDPYWLELDITPVRNDSGEVMHFVAIERDVTARKEMTERLEQMRVSQALEAMTGSLAHDLNSILGIAIGNAELLSTELASSEFGRMADDIVHAMERAADLTRGLLAFARRQTLRPRTVHLVEHLRGLIRTLRRHVAPGIELRLLPVTDDPTVHVDTDRLDQAIEQLISNASTAMPEGGSITIGVAIEAISAQSPGGLPRGRYAVVRIEDEGHGIDPDMARSMFEPFATSDSSGRRSGLGLAMVNGFTRQSGGSTRVAASSPDGTVMEFLLPLVDPPDVVDLGPDDREAVAPRPSRILVVEDEDLLRRLVVEQIRRLGYDSVSVGDGEAALDVLRSNADIDLLFTDVVLSGTMSGLTLASVAAELRPELPVLFTSGHAHDQLVLDGAGVEHLDALQKPYRLDDLRVAIAGCLEARTDHAEY